ncbi:MAG TPA: WecB/TagA/CpsF family glycosyltransferase [Acidothermaceae bacterium]|nr:WecB/TagA/CpsF family glycosyltransferase [Acidothermaceae bacterium]
MTSVTRAEPLRLARASFEPPPVAEVFGVPLHPLTMAQTVDRVEQLVSSGGVHQHVVLNAAKVVQLADDAELRQIVRRCSLVNADGQAVVWAARLLGVGVPERVTGIDLMERLLERAAQRGWSVFFLGATDDVVRRVVAIETERYPGLVVAGCRNGFWSTDEEHQVVAEVAAARPTLLLVALPTPAKERFLARNLDALGAAFAMGVGGSFDVVAGVTRRAPGWMQRLGLEWCYRLLQEPRRMFRRYLVGNTRFVALTWSARLAR